MRVFFLYEGSVVGSDSFVDKSDDLGECLGLLLVQDKILLAVVFPCLEGFIIPRIELSGVFWNNISRYDGSY